MTGANSVQDPQVVRVSAKDIIQHIREWYLVPEEDRVLFADVIDRAYRGKVFLRTSAIRWTLMDIPSAEKILTFAKHIGLSREDIIAALDR